jgi:DNA-binding MarR family transcriptional regulator
VRAALGELAASEAPPLGGVLDFMRLLWAVDHQLQAASKRMQSRLGVTGPQRLALRIVGRFPGISAGRLARVLHVHPSTLTGVLERLERRRLLRRWRDPRDARRALFGLSEVGRSVDGERGQTIEKMVERALARLPPERVKLAEEVLRAVAAELSSESGA